MKSFRSKIKVLMGTAWHWAAVKAVSASPPGWRLSESFMGMGKGVCGVISVNTCLGGAD